MNSVFKRKLSLLPLFLKQFLNKKCYILLFLVNFSFITPNSTSHKRAIFNGSVRKAVKKVWIKEIGRQTGATNLLDCFKKYCDVHGR